MSQLTKCNNPKHRPQYCCQLGVTEGDVVELTKAQKYWWERYKAQREMERTTPWAFCPWCGKKLAINIQGHICGEPDID